MPSATADLLDQLMVHQRKDGNRPWGFMNWLDAPGFDLTVKYLSVKDGQRTSLQRHDRKDELIIFGTGTGYIEIDGECWVGCCLRIRPGTVHRVIGPLQYIEVSTYDDGTDTVRLEDDYGRP